MTLSSSTKNDDLQGKDRKKFVDQIFFSRSHLRSQLVTIRVGRFVFFLLLHVYVDSICDQENELLFDRLRIIFSCPSDSIV